ncbi:TetR family transcriptional regulator [Erythrobacter sp. QSSC1-22B]|uniref:TetR/AcrR family transcriptional regulator n=1 Tax=Erythrobacter sp. QSSC1-22B TaxID=1860125 RepID=UPI000805838D|nr:TetR/AcrR family transcriptional regulator [Erythrobacter sp. QSSC1-22B]OBX18276.1 TetR family transcriptional regulator [Erythrobacter sp. QSSC1-22B]
MATAKRPDPPDTRSASPGKEPRTARGRATMRKLLDAAAKEFGDRGFYEASISDITRRAGTALGSFYTYFDSKEAIFSALVQDMSQAVARTAAAAVSPGSGGVDREREVLIAFLNFARDNKAIYRIIDEAEFADPASYRAHYEGAASRIAARLDEGVANHLVRPGDNEARAWAIMGMNVFLGLRYGIWEDSRPSEEIAAATEDLLRNGIAAPTTEPS